MTILNRDLSIAAPSQIPVSHAPASVKTQATPAAPQGSSAEMSALEEARARIAAQKAAKAEQAANNAPKMSEEERSALEEARARIAAEKAARAAKKDK